MPVPLLTRKRLATHFDKTSFDVILSCKSDFAKSFGPLTMGTHHVDFVHLSHEMVSTSRLKKFCPYIDNIGIEMTSQIFILTEHSKPYFSCLGRDFFFCFFRNSVELFISETVNIFEGILKL